MDVHEKMVENMAHLGPSPKVGVEGLDADEL